MFSRLTCVRPARRAIISALVFVSFRIFTLLRCHVSRIGCLAQPRLQGSKPDARIRSVNDAPQESQPSRHVGSILPLCFQLLQSAAHSTSAQPPTPGNGEGPAATPLPPSPWTCPQCGGPMIILERLTAAQIALRSPPLPLARNS